MTSTGQAEYSMESLSLPLTPKMLLSDIDVVERRNTDIIIVFLLVNL